MPRRVLCIEADASSRERLRELLEREGFAVDLAGSGLEGIARALTLPPDLLLADVHQPDLEGAELAARLKKEPLLARVPFVALGDSSEERELALAAGADGFVERGREAELAAEVRAFLDGKRERLDEAGERVTLRALSGSMAARLEHAVAGARQATQRVEELARLRRAFIHNLSHELSTPLTPLAGYLRILSSGKLGALTPQQRRIVDAMTQSVGRLSRVVDNLSDFASLDVGQVPLREGELQPDQLADDVVGELAAPIREARLHVTVLHAGGGPVAADPRKLRLALANLVGNAVKFSPHGGEVLVEVARVGGRLRFTVYDQGPGVGPEEADHIFEPLYHAAVRGEAARLPGTGLGLPVARRVAEAHGGRVWVESPPRTQPAAGTSHFTGAKFSLEIPARPWEGARPSGPAPAASPA
jgi:signal transduction histidine kinase